jgi:hypothetical protein
MDDWGAPFPQKLLTDLQTVVVTNFKSGMTIAPGSI